MHEPQVSASQYDRFDVVLTGQTQMGVDQNKVITSLTEILQCPRMQMAEIFSRQERWIIKKNIPHKTAYEIQQKIERIGAEVILIRRVSLEKETEFSLVPEGEEQTPFDVLAKRLQHGEQISCKHCGTRQSNAPYCIHCGKQLIGRISIEPDTSTKKTGVATGLIVLAIFLIGFGAYFLLASPV